MDVEEPEQAPPWRPEDGKPPVMWSWPAGKRPALRARINGRWRLAVVVGRDDYPDGRVAYRVVVTMPAPAEGGYERVYWWPQPGLLRPAWGSSVEPTRAS